MNFLENRIYDDICMLDTIGIKLIVTILNRIYSVICDERVVVIFLTQLQKNGCCGPIRRKSNGTVIKSLIFN